MAGFCERLPIPPNYAQSSPTQLLVGQLTRLPYHSGYATIFNPVSVICRNKNARNVTETVKIHFEISRTSSPLPLATPLNCLQLPPSLRLPRSPFRIPLLSYLCPPVHPLLPFPFP